MQGAFDELVDGRIARRNFTEALEGARAATTQEQREAVLTRIEKKEVSKGRYAQRLAAHIEQADDLPTRIRPLLQAEGDAVVTQDDLLRMGGCGPLLALINQLCLACLDRPLVPAPGPEPVAEPAGETPAAD